MRGCRYAEAYITDQELETLPGRTREQVKRAAMNAQQIYGAPGGWGGGGAPGALPKSMACADGPS